VRYLIAMVVLLVTGCGSVEYLGPEWAPLEKIVESKVVSVGLSPRGAITIGDTIYVVDLELWNEVNPEPERTGILKHEQVHAVRQAKMGLGKWLGKYLTDTEFMRREELLGWYAKLAYFREVGHYWDPVEVAASLHEVYQNVHGPMVSEEDALEWALLVRGGAWVPDE